MRSAPRSLALTGALLALAPAALAGELSMSIGLDYSSGEYGGTETTETWSLPLIAKYETGPLTLKMSLPYIRTSGPGDVVGIGPDRVPVPGAGNEVKTESGIGDMVLSASYGVLDGSKGLLLDVIGKVKLPTADEDRGLGTGETDFALQLDAATAFGATTLFGTLGWKKYGDPSGIDYRDPVYASIGAGYKLMPQTTVGLSYDWREKVTRNGDEISEATLFVSHKLDAKWKLQGYLVKGFSDASPEIGGGMILTHIY